MITMDEVSKRQYELEEGDAIIPLYPLQDDEEEDDYYKGTIMVIKDIEAGDKDLERINVADKSLLHYGFLIRDVRMNIYYLSL